MEVNKQIIRTLLVDLLKNFKTVISELMAHQIVMQAMAKTAGYGQPGIDEMLTKIRQSHRFSESIRQRVEFPVEKFLQIFDESSLSQESLEFLQKWIPKGPIN